MKRERDARRRSRQASELDEELLKLRKEQFALRLQRATGQAAKPDQFSKVRKNIARLKTMQREQRAEERGVRHERKRPKRKQGRSQGRSAP